MKILHLMLACFYIDGYNYQENILPRINKEDGNKVKIIASTEVFIDNMNLGYVEPGRYFNEDGIEIVRLPYKKRWGKLKYKIREYVGLIKEIELFSPDIIICHGTQFKDLDKVIEYKKNNTKVKIYADSHEDTINSANNFISKNILYKLYYNSIIKKNLPYIEKILCVGKTSIDFMHDICKVPDKYLEFYPLGGIVDSDREYLIKRIEYRRKLNIKDDEILILHSGKMSKEKNTEELLKAFSKFKEKKYKLVIIGSISEDIKEELMKLIKSDNRINYLGWQKGSELSGYLNACDIYVQPGSQSATMQNAACSRAALILAPHENHKYLFGDAALYAENENEIYNVLRQINDDKINLNEVKKNCFSIACRKLDYKNLAARLYR